MENLVSLDAASLQSTQSAHPTRARTENRTGRIALTILALWLAAALALSLSGVMRGLPPPAIPGMILSAFIAFLVAYFRIPSLRAWVLQVDMRPLVLYHLVRVPFGIAFLVMAARGTLPGEFAGPAGYGDIAAGLGAIVAFLCVPATTRRRRGVVALWNALALADIMMVFALAQRIIIFGDMSRMQAMLDFPFSTIPVFVVPMILITHFAIFAQLRRGGAAPLHRPPASY